MQDVSMKTPVKKAFFDLKNKRAILTLTIIGGVIGVLAIAVVFSLSNGVQGIVASASEGTLRNTPITISSEEDVDEKDASTVSTTKTTEQQYLDGKPAFSVAPDVSDMLETVGDLDKSTKENDLVSLRKHIESEGSEIKEKASSIEYDYGTTPIFFQNLKEGTNRQIYPEQDLVSFGLNVLQEEDMVTAFSADSSTFVQMPVDQNLYRSSYNLLAGQWPEKNNECILIVDKDAHSLSDFFLYQVGLLNPAEMESMIEEYMETGKVTTKKHEELFTYNDLMSCTFKIVVPASVYSYNERYHSWVNSSLDAEYMKGVLEQSDTMRVCGVASYSGKGPKSIDTGLAYLPGLLDDISSRAATYDIVKSQLNNSAVNAFNGKPFSGEGSSFSLEDLNLMGIFSLNEEALYEALEDLVDMLEIPDVDVDWSIIETVGNRIAIALDKLRITTADLENIFEDVEIDEWEFPEAPVWDWDLSVDEQIDIVLKNIDQLLKTAFVVQDGVVVELKELDESQFKALLRGDGRQSIVAQICEAAGLDSSEVDDVYTWYDEELLPYLDPQVEDILDDAYFSVALLVNGRYAELVVEEISKIIDELVSQITTPTGDFDFDGALELVLRCIKVTPNPSTTTEGEFENALGQVLGVNLSRQDVSAMITLILGGGGSYEQNLSRCGYMCPEGLNAIKIFTADVDARSDVKDALDSYNEQMKKAGNGKDIVFYDLVGDILVPLNIAMNALGPILAFPIALSLLVFAVLIAITTMYDFELMRNVVEEAVRRGASRGNVFAYFLVQAAAKGLFSGIFGVILALALGLLLEVLVNSAQLGTTFLLRPGQALGLMVIAMVIAAIAGGLTAAAKTRKLRPKHLAN